MNHKIIATFVVLIFAVGFLGIVVAEDNNTTELGTIEDAASYIMPISISENAVEFSDGFTGYCLDLTKEPISAEDGFVSQPTGSDEIQNYIKLAIVEAYKQGCEDNLDQIISSFADGSYKDSDNEVIAEVLKSQETVGDEAVVELEDSIEGTFEFELLKPADGNKSDFLAYKVSLKEMPADDNATEENGTNPSEAILASSSDDNQSQEKSAALPDNASEDAKKAENASEEDKIPETIVNETNKTIINRTNTIIVNENNTTIVNQTNIKHINKTTNDEPKKEDAIQQLVKTVGNPIFLLFVVIVIAAIVAVAMQRKG